MGLSARRLAVDLTATWHSVKSQQQGRWCMQCMTLKWIHRTAQCKHTFSVIKTEQGAEQIKTQEWGDSRAPVYVRSSTEANICFSFQGRSKNWWRRPLKILVVSGKRLLSLNPETRYRLWYCLANSPTQVYKWITFFTWRALFYASSFGGDDDQFQKAV